MSARCVNCGYPKEQHAGESLVCRGSAGLVNRYYATMELPAGLTCGDCQFMRFCKDFLDRGGTETSCDWYPIKFVPDLAKFQQVKGGKV